MSVYGSLDTAPRIVQRSTHLIDLAIRNREGTDRYRLWGAKKVNDAYGDLEGASVTVEEPVLMLEALKDRVSQSPSVLKSGRMLDENRRGQTTFMFDPDDYVGQVLNGDDFPVYVRVQEHRAGEWQTVKGILNTDKPVLGPIVIIPPPKFYGSLMGSVTFVANAPVDTTCEAGEIPAIDLSMQAPLPMHLILPKPCIELLITPLDEDKNILVSFGLGEPMMEISKANPLISKFSRVREVVIAAKDLATSFNFHAVMSHTSAWMS